MSDRAPGFYWVELLDGEITVGQWSGAAWTVPGSDCDGPDEACRVLSERLIAPNEAKEQA